MFNTCFIVCISANEVCCHGICVPHVNMVPEDECCCPEELECDSSKKCEEDINCGVGERCCEVKDTDCDHMVCAVPEPCPEGRSVFSLQIIVKLRR